MKLFLRVLIPDSDGKPGTFTRWLQRKYTSTHARAPEPWIERWNLDQSTNLKDYPLNVQGAEYTRDALKAFLKYAPLHPKSTTWPAEELVEVGEYKGVAAYETAAAALKYGQSLRDKRYVVFEGQEIAQLPGESEAWLVKFMWEIDPPMTEDEFRRRYVKAIPSFEGNQAIIEVIPNDRAFTKESRIHQGNQQPY